MIWIFLYLIIFTFQFRKFSLFSCDSKYHFKAFTISIYSYIAEISLTILPKHV